jgi:RND family efflux transporter MFP subunit
MPDDAGHGMVCGRRPARLGMVLCLFAAAALIAVAYGVIDRRRAETHLEQETQAAAVPVVSVITPERGSGVADLVLPGDVEAFYDAPIYARVNGYVQNWFSDIGARVRKGQVLASIETPDLDQQLAQAKGELAMAEAKASLAAVTAKRWHNLLSSNSVSQQSADEKAGDELAQKAAVDAQRAHVQSLVAMVAFKKLTAPFDGVVTARNTDIGALINRGAAGSAPLFRVADMHEMRVYVKVPQVYASQLHIGMKAVLTQPQYTGTTFPATLVTTSNAVNRESRTVLAQLQAANDSGKLWPGTYARVDFHLSGDPNVLRLPTSSLIFRRHGAQLAVVGGDNVIHMRNVVLGRNLGAEIEVLSGLDPSDHVVDTPLDTLQDGEAVRIADEKGD